MFTPTFGIEIDKTELDRLDGNALTKLVLQHKFVLVRSLSLTPDQLIAYGRKFGKLYISSVDLRGQGENLHIKSTQHPEITVLSREGMHQDNSIAWHIDLIHKPLPIMLPGRILYAHDFEIETDTCWSDTEHALRILDTNTLKVIESELCFHTALYKTAWRGSVRKMINTHPLTGHNSLFFDQAFSTCVIGESYEYTTKLKRTIFTQTLVDDNIYTHHWQQGDFVVYDNNSTIHMRENFPLNSKGNRTMWRLTFDF